MYKLQNFVIIFFNSIYFYLNQTNIDVFSIRKDQWLLYLSAKKMSLLDLSYYTSAIDQHTPLITHFYKLNYELFKNFFQDEQIMLIIHSVFYMLLNLLIFYLLYLLLNNKNISLIFSLLITFSLSFNSLNNRTFGSLFLIAALISLFKYFKYGKITYLYLFEFLLILNVYNLESYFVDFVFLNLIFLIIRSKNLIKIYRNILFASFLSTISILFVHIFVNKDIIDLIRYTVVVHLKFTYPKSDLNFYEFIAFNSSDTFVILFVLSIVILVYLAYTQNLDNFYKIIILLFISRILQLLITGRYPVYGYLLIIPELLLISYFINSYLRNNYQKIYASLFFITLLIIPLNYRIKYEDQNNPIDSIDLNNYINLNENENVLTWVDPHSLDLFFIKNKIVPSTRYWWFFYMKYVQQDKYNLFDEKVFSDIQANLLNDLQNENPKYFIQQLNFEPIPDPLQKYLENNFVFFNEGDNYRIYVRNS